MTIEEATKDHADRVAITASVVLKILDNHLGLDLITAEAMILGAFGILAAAHVPEATVADFCQKLWAGLESELESAKTLLAMPAGHTIHA